MSRTRVFCPPHCFRPGDAPGRCQPCVVFRLLLPSTACRYPATVVVDRVLSSVYVIRRHNVRVGEIAFYRAA